MADYDFSTSYAEGILRALKRTPKAQAIAEQLSPEARALFDNPFSDPWQPARLLEEVGEKAVRELGENAFEDITRTAMKERVGPILVPMIKSTLATKSPANVFKKLPDLTRMAIRGVGLAWQAEGDEAGVLQVSYPRPVAKHVVTSWVGVIKFVFEITTPGDIKQATQSPDGLQLTYVVTWPAPKK